MSLTLAYRSRYEQLLPCKKPVGRETLPRCLLDPRHRSAPLCSPSVQRHRPASQRPAGTIYFYRYSCIFIRYRVAGGVLCVVCLRLGPCSVSLAKLQKFAPLVVRGEGATLYDKFLPEVHGLWQVLGGRCTVYGDQQAETDTAVFYTVSMQNNYPFSIF